MSQFFHFIILILEFSLCPVVVFFITYVSKHKSYQTEQSTSDSDKLVADGYELVLIETFAHFGLFLRIATVEATGLNEYTKVILLSMAFLGACVMGGLFVYGWIKNGHAIAKEVSDIKITFHSCFFSWWFRLAVSGVYAHYFTADLSFMILMLLLLASSFSVFQSFVNTYFIKWTDLFRQLTMYAASGNSTQALKKGKQILNRFHTKEGDDYIMALAETSAELAIMYFPQQNPPNKGLATATRYLENYLNHPQSGQFDKTMHALILAGISCKNGDKQKAIQTIKNYLPEDSQSRYIDYIHNNKYNLIVPMDK